MPSNQCSITAIPVGQLKSNCYIYSKGDKCLIIDAGDDAELIKSTVQTKNLTPTAVISTHGHFDHNLAAMDICLAYKINLYIHSKDMFLLERQVETTKYFLDTDVDPIPMQLCKSLMANKQILKTYKLQIINTPGHTPGSVSLYSSEQSICFVGDLIFEKGSFGRYDFSYSDKISLFDSIKKITSLPKDTFIYSGHGEKFLLSNW